MGGWGWGFDRRSVEELVRSETKLGQVPRRGQGPEPPPRPRTWLGAAGALGLVSVAVLWVLLSDGADEPDATPASPSPSHGAVAASMPPGHAWGAVTDR